MSRTLPIQPVRVKLVPKHAFEIAELDAAAGICRARAFKLIREGKLRAKKDGSKTIILARDLDAYLDSLADARPEQAA